MLQNQFFLKTDEKTGLQAFVALQGAEQFPALGGCRLVTDMSSEQALQLAANLANGMSLKSAIHELPLSGGKAVVIAPAQLPDRKAYFHAFGKFVHELGGRYVTAVDIGVYEQDMEWVAEKTPFVTCDKKTGGDPSPITSTGIRLGIEAAVRWKLKRATLEGIHIAVQGVGKVGYPLVKELHARGAIISVADSNQKAIERVVDEFNVRVINPEQIYSEPCDVFAPCALGSILNATTIPLLQAKIVAGGANTQLQLFEHGELLHNRNILYAPDFVINGGGLIYAAAYYLQTPLNYIEEKLNNISDLLIHIFEKSRQQHRGTYIIANEMAMEKRKMLS